MWHKWRKSRSKHEKEGGVLPTTTTSSMKKKTSKIKQRQLFRVTSIAAGIQFGWALQLSLLTPYVQELGIPHTFASYIWLCGPITGMIVQPIVGYYSDNCGSKWGRRRPFIVVGCIFVVVAVLLIGFSADIGHLFGDALDRTRKTRAIAMFVLGFWLLDLANNTLQGPCRALLADFTGHSQRRARRANAFFSCLMAIGNILGYAAGAYSSWYKVFTFSKTAACNEACANLKSAFFLHIIILITTTLLSITAVREIPLDNLTTTGSTNDNLRRILNSNNSTEEQQRRDLENGRKNYSDSTLENGKLVAKPWNTLSADYSKELETILSSESLVPMDAIEPLPSENKAFLWELFDTLKTLPRQMWYILLVTALTWIAWFPFLLYDTDWMGSDIYRGDANSKIKASNDLYNRGVRMGSFGLMLNAVVLGLTSLMVEPLCRRVPYGPSSVWAVANLLLACCLGGMVWITKVARRGPVPPSPGVLAIILLLFSIIGAPLAVTYSVPYALTSTFTSSVGGGQGLSMGVLNLSIVFPQLLISIGIGPWDQAFGGGNIPAFSLALVAAFLGGVLAALKLPKPPTKRDQEPPPIEIEFPTPGIRRTRSAPVFLKVA